MNLSRTLGIVAVVFVVSLVILSIQAAAKNRTNPPGHCRTAVEQRRNPHAGRACLFCLSQ
jgi:preprotein translocase subunit SecG